MTGLDDADRALLAAEGVAIDLDAAAKAARDEHDRFWRAAGRPTRSPFPTAWDETNTPTRESWLAVATAALRAAGLVPGKPSLPLLLAAIRRRGWDCRLVSLTGGDGYRGLVIRSQEAPPPAMGWVSEHLGWTDHADPATALALAFCAAVRAAGDGEGEG